MKVHAAEALILRTHRYGEADRIVVFLTADRGKRRGVAKNASKSRRRFGGALEPLTRGRVHYVEKEGRDLVRLDRIEPKRSPMQGFGDAQVIGHASYFAELLDEWAPENQANERLFRLGAGIGDALGRAGSVEALARYFEYWLLKLEGVYPPWAELEMSAAAKTFLKRVHGLAPRDAAMEVVERRVLREVERVHHAMISMHLDKELRSARVVRELRPEL